MAFSCVPLNSLNPKCCSKAATISFLPNPWGLESAFEAGLGVFLAFGIYKYLKINLFGKISNNKLTNLLQDLFIPIWNF
jgi:hypothetical protein